MLPWILALLGIGAVLATVTALVVGGLLLGPLLVWLAWNVLDLGHAVGAGELGFWGIVLVAVFLAVGGAGRIVIVAVVFLLDPGLAAPIREPPLAGADVQELRRDRAPDRRGERVVAPGRRPQRVRQNAGVAHARGARYASPMRCQAAGAKRAGRKFFGGIRLALAALSAASGTANTPGTKFCGEMRRRAGR